MTTNALRTAFLRYFEEKGHTLIPSSPTVPHDDPTLLFCNAGMNQFKDVFLGQTSREYSRATTSQKCIRVGGKHNDLENVGHTTRHMTFFEMLGNFSFGDYFKKEAIAFAWEVATKVFEFPIERLWVSVFEKDDEAFDLWKEHIAEDRIVRIGEKDNFWQMGDTGPCGPCSELFIDRGEQYGTATTPANDPDGERFLEFWNLVFMQYNRSKDGTLTPLKNQSIDTGAGLERVAMLKMGVDSVFKTDLLQYLIAHVEELTGNKYTKENEAPFHVISDHIRCLAFAIADGAQPSNVDRGYVLRKVLRRAVRYGRKLGMNKPFLAKLIPPLIEQMGEAYPELVQSKERIQELLTLEEESFLKTLSRGGNILQTIIDDAQEIISGDDAFKLKDTYGFPLEEIELIAKDNNLKIDTKRFAVLEKEAKEKSRAARNTVSQEVEATVYKEFVEKHGETEFNGYDQFEEDATIIGLIKDGTLVESLDEGDEGIVLVNRTPFYAEMGGQVGDTGVIDHKSAHFAVQNTQSPFAGVIAHVGTLEKGTLFAGEPIHLAIDVQRRKEIQKHHTATHLLHYALCQVFGDHIKQAGSLVKADGLRFDFSHHKQPTQEELAQVEGIVNDKIFAHSQVTTEEIPFSEAQKDASIKQFFGDKYGNTVRVVRCDTYANELCGGTHVSNTAEIGFFKIAKESSVAKGVRRIEGVIGAHAYALTKEHENELSRMADLLNTPLSKLPTAFDRQLEELASLKTQVKELTASLASFEADNLIAKAEKGDGYTLIASRVNVSPKQLPQLANELSDKVKNGAILLACVDGEKCQLLIRIGQELVERGLSAGALIKDIAPLVGGGGGGKKDAAQAGGKDPSGIDAALDVFATKIEESCLKQ